jgi:hypothetical protein
MVCCCCCYGCLLQDLQADCITSLLLRWCLQVVHLIVTITHVHHSRRDGQGVEEVQDIACQGLPCPHPYVTRLHCRASMLSDVLIQCCLVAVVVGVDMTTLEVVVNEELTEGASPEEIQDYLGAGTP